MFSLFRYERSVIRLTIDAQSDHNPEMRVSAETDPRLDLIAGQLDQITQVRYREFLRKRRLLLSSVENLNLGSLRLQLSTFNGVYSLDRTQAAM